jgi:hypothetical protein
MRAVLDTNVLVSGLFWLGAPHDLIEQVRHGSLSINVPAGCDGGEAANDQHRGEQHPPARASDSSVLRLRVHELPLPQPSH